jgi:hypothetical protein
MYFFSFFSTEQLILEAPNELFEKTGTYVFRRSWRSRIQKSVFRNVYMCACIFALIY